MTTTNTAVIKNLLLLFLIFAGLYYAREFLIPLAMGSILATLFLPLCKWLEQKFPKALSVLICVSILLLTIATIVVLLGWQVSELVNDIALLKYKATETYTSSQDYILKNLGISVKDQAQIIKDEHPSLSGIVQLIFDSLTGLFTNFLLVMVYVFSLLYYRQHIKNFLLKLTPADQKKEIEQVIHQATFMSQQYLLGLSKMIFCLWIMYGIGFSIIGVPNALFFAILCGLFEVVPYVGNITGTILTVLVAFIHGGNLSMLGGIVLTYGVAQLIQGWILEPLILGPQVKINPFFTIVALVLGQLVWGIPGIILAIPLTAIIKIICDHIEPLKPYGFLIGEIITNKTRLKRE